MEYQVKAVRGREIVYLDLAASSLEDALGQAKTRGYTPISAQKNQSITKRAGNKKFPLALFSQELLTLLDAGLNLVESIEALAEKDSRPEVKSVLDTLLQSLYQGQTFSDALEQQSNVFPVLYVSTVRASEKTGDLPEAMTRYVKYEAQLTILKKKVVSASIYPLLLMSVGGLVILFLLGFVVPKFSTIYEGTGDDLPFMSEVLMSWGLLLEAHGEKLLIALVALLVLLGFALTQAATKKFLVRQLWKVPAFGEKLRVYQYARFYRTLGMLLKGGTSIIPAVKSVTSLLDVSLQKYMQGAEQAITQGQPISVALENAGLTTPIALRMLRVGEKSGNIGDMMERIASFYDEELSRWIDWFTKLFEPILMLVIGLVIGAVVLLLYMPIFELAGSIQ